MLETALTLVDRHARLARWVLIAMLAASLFGMARLSVLDSPERWMPASTRQGWEVFQRHFDVGDSIALGLHFRRPVRDDDLPRLRRLRRDLERVAGMKQVYDPSLVADKIERVPLTTLIDPAHDERFSLYTGALWDRAQAGDPARMLMVVCELDSRAYVRGSPELDAMRRRAVAEMDAVIDRQRQSGGWGDEVEFHAAGGVMMMADLELRAKRIAVTFLPAAIGVGLVTLVLGFRSWRPLVVAGGGSAVAMLLVLGGLGALGGTLDVVTIGTPVLMSVVAVASTVHFASYAAEHPSTARRTVVGRGHLIHWVGVPCLGAALTTGVGFLMLCFNELTPIRELGLQLFAGSLLAFLGVFLVSDLVPIRQAHRGRWLRSDVWRRFADRTTRRPRGAILLVGILAAALAFCAWPRPADHRLGVHVDADPFSFFPDDEPIARALGLFSDREFGVYQLDIVLVPRERAGDGPLAEANLASAARFSDVVAARRDLGVLRVVSTKSFRDRQAQFQERLANTLHEEGWRAYAAELTRAASSAMVFADTFQNWSRDKLDQDALRLTFLAHEQPRGFGPLLSFVEERLPHDRFECCVTGSIAENVHLAEGLSGGVLWGLGSSLAIMVLLCVGLFRSARLALISLGPNLFPILVVFGLMGLAGLPLSSGSAMVATIALGISLNDTIHFVLHYRQLTRGEGLSVEQGVRETLAHIGRPIVLTSLVHAAGFSIFLLTDFLPLVHFGVLSVVAMLAALVGDLVLLPNLLAAFDRPPTLPHGEPLAAPHVHRPAAAPAPSTAS